MKKASKTLLFPIIDYGVSVPADHKSAGGTEGDATLSVLLLKVLNNMPERERAALRRVFIRMESMEEFKDFNLSDKLELVSKLGAFLRDRHALR